MNRQDGPTQAEFHEAISTRSGRCYSARLNRITGLLLTVLLIAAGASGRTEATDLGLLKADQSIDWFEQYIGTHSDLSSDALAAISMHEGDHALKILIGIVESDAGMDIREDAVFWMAQSDSEAAFNYLDRLLMID